LRFIVASSFRRFLLVGLCFFPDSFLCPPHRKPIARLSFLLGSFRVHLSQPSLATSIAAPNLKRLHANFFPCQVFWNFFVRLSFFPNSEWSSPLLPRVLFPIAFNWFYRKVSFHPSSQPQLSIHFFFQCLCFQSFARSLPPPP